MLGTRGMMRRHGFGLEGEEGEAEAEAEEWRKGKVVLVAHSLGSGPVAWLLRDAVSCIFFYTLDVV